MLEVAAWLHRGSEDALAHGVAQYFRAELHALPLLHALGLAREPEEGATQLLHHREHRAARLPPQVYGRALGRQLHAVDEPA
eukprot:scaffold40670_cov63-Phaeocystis_antarctica.AAC.4